MTTLTEAIKQHLAVDENGLRKCPFCKEAPKIRKHGAVYSDGRFGAHVECFFCKISRRTAHGNTMQEAVGRAIYEWNTRVSDPLLLEYARRLEKVERILKRAQTLASSPMVDSHINTALAAITAPFEGKL